MNTRIIVVDDDRDYLELTRAKLITTGFNNLRTEDDPLKVASLFESEEVFDIALIDVNMPEMSGFELLELIKTISPKTECIMVTAVNDARTAVECLHLLHGHGRYLIPVHLHLSGTYCSHCIHPLRQLRFSSQQLYCKILLLYQHLLRLDLST